jgi:hypothetical protein
MTCEINFIVFRREPMINLSILRARPSLDALMDSEHMIGSPVSADLRKPWRGVTKKLLCVLLQQGPLRPSY